ncbi:CCR4-NOT core subunit cdc39, partial [Spiromyces aspiralis]
AEPILLPLSLISTKSGFPALHNLFYQATNHFLRNKSPKSNLYFELFRILDKKALLDALYYIYRQDRDSISHSLDVLVDLNMFRDTVLIPRREEIEFLDFILELAILADRREYLVFESWYGTVLAEFGNEMLHHSLDILNSKVLLERERQQGEIPKGVRFSLDEFEVMFSTLSKVKMSPNNTENFKSIYRFFKELLPDLTAAREKDNAVTSAQVEEKADRLFLDLYKNKISFKTMVETLAHYRDSAERELRNTAKHVIQYPIEEFKFFANYPERELGITGRL